MKASCAEVREVLKSLHFPLTKQNLIQQATKHGAASSVIEDIQKIPDREYPSLECVIHECEKT